MSKTQCPLCGAPAYYNNDCNEYEYADKPQHITFTNPKERQRIKELESRIEDLESMLFKYDTN